MPIRYYDSVKVFFPDFTREELITRLREAMPALSRALPVTRATLFGSWAKGRATAFSDIDLLVVYQDPPSQDAFRLVCQTIDLRGLEPHIYTESQAAALESTLRAMTAEGVELLETAPSPAPLNER